MCVLSGARIALCPSTGMLAFSDTDKTGTVQLRDLKDKSSKKKSWLFFEMNRVDQSLLSFEDKKSFNAHATSVVAMAFNRNGTLFATASSRV
jgi:hypothetical protein